MTTDTIFTAKVRVAGVTKEVPVSKDESGRYFVKGESISFKHRAGQKTYSLDHAQVVPSRDGVFKPTTAWILRKVASPCGWGDGTTTRNY